MTTGSREYQTDPGRPAVPLPGALGLRMLEQKLQIKSGRSVAVINAPSESTLRLLSAGKHDPDQADVVIGFATRPVDLAWLKPAYAAAHAGRLAWVSYPEPGQPGTALRRDWLVRALHQYGVEMVQEVSIDPAWRALRLRAVKQGHQPETPVPSRHLEC